jgi:tetratricopeptide (TPR) repeat protein
MRIPGCSHHPFPGAAVLVLALLPGVPLAAAEDPAAVKAYEGSVSIPTYEHSGRELQPPLFGNSTVTGLYPFTTFLMPFKSGGPEPRAYRAIFLENEYLKLTYLPELGGRLFSLYDKVRGREVFYRNDVIKPAHYNPRISWPQSGVELTGPYDAHMLTLYGEPFWSNKVLRHADGSVSLMLGELDPVYRMKVNLTATLHPGLAAMQISVFCYNTRDGRMPQMFWISAALPGTEKTRFIYPMTRTIGHTTSEIGDWPVYNGIDYSWDRNNKNMLGVFGIDIYDDFQGAYHHDLDYGVFRHADRRIVQGMKMWTFGYGRNAKNLERGYTDNAGPYVEVQSGRHVWDGHYEWVYPHKVESWSEWWFPVAGIGGFTTTARDVALNLEVNSAPAGGKPGVKVGLSANRALPGTRILVKAQMGEILNTVADLAPGKPFNRVVSGLDAGSSGLSAMVVTVTDTGGHQLLSYARPDSDPGRKEYTPFTRPLERPQKQPEQMTVEELALAAEFKLKGLNAAAGLELLTKSLERDPGYSRAHLLLGIHHFTGYRYAKAAEHLEKAIERDPYLDEAYYYLSASQMRLGQTGKAERNLYYLWPGSAYYSDREYNLARIALSKGRLEEAAKHLETAIGVNGHHLSARGMLALVRRARGDRQRAMEQITALERLDPTSHVAQAEKLFLTGDKGAQAELLRLMGGQSQEAINASGFYRRLNRWKEAVEILRLVEKNNRDPWGTPAEFHYILAHCLSKSGAGQEAAASLEKARASAGNVDRFPYREDSEPALTFAVETDPRDAVARFYLACLQYHLERPEDAIRNWEAAVAASPNDFRSRRALGLAYAEQGHGIEKAAAQLEKAIHADPAHVRTLNDLSTIYAQAGRFDEQLAVLKKALARSPNDDNLAEGVLTANLIKGAYGEADKLIASHRFGPRHRSYGLRDKYRFMRYAMGAAAFKKGDASEAVKQFEAALNPPVSLGVDDFTSQTSPRRDYYIGRAYEAQGRAEEARRAYERAVTGVENLSGDADSWSSENFHMVLALERLGRKDEAVRLAQRFENYARSQFDSTRPLRRAESRYLLALVAKRGGRVDEAKRLMEEAVKVQPDFLAPRLELRGDVIDPIAN